MNSRERVLASLARRPADRTPIFMWFHPEMVHILAARLEIPPGAVDEVMGNDVRQVWVGNNYAMEGIVHEKDGEGHTDAWGVEWVRWGGFNQIKRHPLAGLDDEELLSYAMPDPDTPEFMAPLAALARGRGDWFIGSDVSPCVFEFYARIRGLEDACCDLADATPNVDRLLDACADFSVRLAAKSCTDAYGVDWLWTGDDVGGQLGMMMSPACWRELIKPRLAKVAAEGLKAGKPVAYHSCGGIRPIIPDLVEIGITVLNPLQSNCPGMDPLELKREFGGHLTFMGGVDTQNLLIHATPTEVRREAERLLAGMTADGGGYILAASHTIAPETPLDNVFALYAAAGLEEEAIRDRAADWRAGRRA